MSRDKSKALVLWLNEVTIEDIPVAGGKNASLGEMIRNLSPLGVKIPYGYVITANAYYYFLDYNNLKDKIREIIEGLNVDDIKDLQKRGYEVRELIRGGEFPPDLEQAIKEYYKKLSEKYNTHAVDVAVRSSAKIGRASCRERV